MTSSIASVASAVASTTLRAGPPGSVSPAMVAWAALRADDDV